MLINVREEGFSLQKDQQVVFRLPAVVKWAVQHVSLQRNQKPTQVFTEAVVDFLVRDAEKRKQWFFEWKWPLPFQSPSSPSAKTSIKVAFQQKWERVFIVVDSWEDPHPAVKALRYHLEKDEVDPLTLPPGIYVFISEKPDYDLIRQAFQHQE